MPRDEIILERILKGLKSVKLEAILVGNTACALQGVPIMTQDIDFFIRDTKLNRKKIKEFAKKYKLFFWMPEEALSETMRVEGKEFVVDFVFRLGTKQSFEKVKSRSILVKVGSLFCRVASLEDVLIAKKEANRPKDRAVIKIIEDTIRIKKALGK